ncbi:MAG: hypothetical protein ACK5LS_06075 [Propioniciclava sp.]
MPETRKHRTHARDDLDQAILAALGENIRPVTPGEEPAASSTEPDDDARPGYLPPGSSLGSVILPPHDGGAAPTE